VLCWVGIVDERVRRRVVRLSVFKEMRRSWLLCVGNYEVASVVFWAGEKEGLAIVDLAYMSLSIWV